MAKKNKKLFDAAGEAARQLESKKTNTGGSGLTQDQINAGIQARRNSILSQPTRHQGTNSTAPAATTGSGRFGALELDRIQRHAGVESTYFDDERRASERIKERSTSAMNRLANAKGPGQEMQVLHEMADERRRLNNANKLRDRSNQGAGKMSTYTNADGSTGYYYQRGKGEQAQLNATFNKNAVPSRVNGMMPQVIDANNKSKRTNIDKGNYYTQESASTMKYDDGKRTEYYEVHGSGDDTYLVSVPEERYYQRVQLDGGVNPSTITPWKRVEAAAEHGFKGAVHGLKSTIGSIKANTNEQERARDYAATHKDGNNLNRRRDMLMSSYGAAGATKNGNDVKANEYVKQEAVEDIMREREQLEKQRELDQLYQAYKAGVSKPAGVFMDVVDTTANMAPGMLSNFILPGSFIPEMAVQAYGNSYNQARNNGASRDEAVLSGLQNAAVESLSEMMFAGGKTLGKLTGVRGIFRPGKEIEAASLGFIKSTAGKDVVRAVQKLGLAGGEEGAEELVAGIVEPLLDNLIYQHEDIDSEWIQSMLHDAAYNALVGFASGGGFGAVDVAQSIRQGSDIRANADVANMINQGLRMPEDSKAYMLARRLDAQYKADPDTLGNLDVSELNRALQEEQAAIQKKYDKKMDANQRSLAKQGVVTSGDEYRFYQGNAEQDYAEGRISKEERDYHMSQPTYRGNEYVDDAVKRLVEKTGMTEEEVKSDAVSIARIFIGQASASDIASLPMSNAAAREVFEDMSKRATGKRITLPESNSATIDVLNNVNADSRTVYANLQNEANKDKSRARKVGKVLSDARIILGRNNKDANDAFREAIQSIPTEDLDAAREEFTFLWSLGGNANLADRSDLREIRVLPLEVQQKAVELGRETVDARYDEDTKRLKKAQEEKDAKEGKEKPKAKHNDIQQKLNDEEKELVTKSGMRRPLGRFQGRRKVRIILESNRTLAELDKQSGREPLDDYSGVNGWYSNGEIHINIEGKDPWSATLSHEFTHHLERYSPAEYRKLINFIKEEKTKNDPEAWQQMINEKMELYDRYDKALSDPDAAVREIVADMAAEFMNDEATVRSLFGYDESLARSVMNKLLRIINDMLDALKGAVVYRGGTQWDGMEDQLKKARQMWLDAAEAARENAGLDLGESGTQFSVKKKGKKEADSDKDSLTVRNAVNDHIDELNEMDAIIDIQVDRVNFEYNSQLVDAVSKEFRKSGSGVDIKGIGFVDLSVDRLNDAVKYLKRDSEKATLILLPKVLKRGKIIYVDKNHKQNGFKSIVIAAKVVMNGKPGIIAVAIRNTKGWRYKVHRVLDLEGNTYVLEYNKKADTSDGSTAASYGKSRLDGDLQKESAYKNTVSSVSESRNQNTQKEQGQFSLSTDSTGRQLSRGQQEYFKDSKIRDEQGRLKVMYHGTDNEFTIFNFDEGGKNGTAEGFGIYTADDRNVSKNYGGRMIEGYVNMTRPAYRDQKTITRNELKKLIRATIDYEVGLWEMDERDSWISNYTDTYSAGSMDIAINDVVTQIMEFNDNDMDIVQEVMSGMAIREYPQAEEFYDILTDVTGIDGFVTNWTDHTTGESSQIALAFRSNQIKNVTNENPTEDPDIRFSIALGMTPEQRYEELKDKTIRVADYNPSLMPTDEHELRALESQVKKQAYPVLRDMARGLGLFRDDHKTPDLDIEFSYSGRGIDTSTQIQARVKLDDKYVSMAKMLTCFNDVLRNAHLIEVHEDENELTKRNSAYKQFNELISAYRDGNSIVPVKLTIAEAKDGFNKVQVSIVLDKIKEADLYTRPGLSQLRALPTSEYSLASLLARVKDPSLREYIPAMFYDEAQNVLSEAGMVEQNGRASWLPRRITYLLSEYGGMGNYASAYAARIAPRDYLKLTLRDEMLDKWNGAVNDKAHPEVKSLDEVKLREERQTPFIIIYSDDGTQVRGHEGRHRMRALMEAGITSVPIVIQDNDTKYSKTPLNSMTLTSQDFGDGAVNNNASVVINDLVPINEAYRAELEEQFGAKEGDQVNFSLASDRDREIADLQSKVERLQRDKRRTYGREASNADATRVARALLADTSSDFSLNQTIKAVKELFTMIKRGDDFADIYGYVQGIARSIADSSYDMVEIPGASDLADLRQRFLDARKSQGGSPLKILIPQNLIGDFDRVGGWKEFRAAHKGIVTLSVNSGESYDSFIEGIADEFGEQFNVEGDNSGIDTLISIIEAADSPEARNPVRKAYKDEDVEGVIPDDVDMGIMGGYRDTEVNEIIDRLLDDVADQVAPDLTFADRKAAEKDAAVRKATENERAKWEARRQEWVKNRDRRLAEMREDKKLAVEAQRAKGKERLQKQAELYRRQREKARERRADTASRRKTLDRIYKTTQRLSQKLLKPTDSQHIPEKYRKAVADMLGWLDFENARTDQWAKRHGNVPSARILNMRKLQEVYAKIAEDEQLNQYIEPDDQIYEWLEYLSDIEGSRLDDLTTEQLRTVRLVLDAVSWQVNNADKALTEGLKQSRADIATELMDELEAQKDEKFSDGTFKKFIKADSTPVHFFERLGLNTLKKLYQQLTLAQDTHIKHLSEAQEYIEKNITSKWGNTAKIGNNSLIKKWTEESEKYELENGKTVEMTGAQVMSLYALNKREQARKHLLGGGIVIAPTKVKRNLKGGIKEYMLDRQLQKTRAELTYADITKILGKMSQEQIDAAEAMLKYLKTTSEWGNETSMKLYGYRKFTEDNYFPIQSAKEFIAGSNLELQRDKKIKNQGMTKNVNEYANNPIVIDDFFEVTTAHINQMSQYNSFVPILEDFDRIYQYSEYDPETQKYHRSVKELIEQKHGRWAADYIENLLKNVNGNYGNEVADIQGFEKLLRNWKAAKIGLSVRVFAQQPTAVVRAFNEIDPKYFVGTPKRGSHKRMWEICPIAEWKHWGYSQTDIHRSMRDTMMGDKHLSDKLFFDMYGKADDLGWGAIFDAVERETKDLMKKGKLKFEYDSAEYRQHVNERFRHIVDRTQVVDSVLHRSQLMRSQNTLTKAMTAFMAEPTISVNTIMTAFTKAQEEARAGHKAAAAKAASRGVGVFVANAVAVSLMASLISAIRESYLPDDDDDDDEKELTKLQQMMVNMGFEEGSFMYDWISGYFVEDFKGNINPLMMIPVAKDMLNMWQGYEAPNPMYQLPQSLIQTTQNMKKWIDEDGDTRYSGRYYIERAAESVAELFGVPAANIRKELIGIQNIYFRAIGEKEYGDYLQDRWELNEDYKSNKNIFIDHYLNAKKAGHDESAKDIREQLLKSKVRDDEGNLVFTDEAIQKRAWSVYAPEYKDDVIAGKDVSKQEKDLKSVGVSQEDIDDKKSKALVSAISEAVEAGDTKRIEGLYTSLEKYGYGEYDVDKKVKSAASDLMYDAIDAEDYEEAERYINVITDVTEYTRDDVVSSITTHYMSNYYESMDAGDQSGVNRVTNILNRYGVSSNTIREKEAEHYKDYYRQKAYMAYSSGNTAEAYRIATEYNQKYPGVYSKGVDGMIYGIQNLSDETIRRYTTSGKYDEWQLP